MSYMPELGQAAWGQEWQRYECPAWLEAFLSRIDEEWRRIWENINQEDSAFRSPFTNSGAEYKNDTFAVEAYSWDDDYDQPWNFYYPASDIKVSWYKWLGRGTTVNREVTPEEGVEMLNACLDSLRRWEEEES